MTRIGRGLASVLPLTRRGSTYLAAALIVLAAGALRAELAALFWGTALLFLVFLSVGGTALASRRLTRHLASNRSLPSLRLPEAAGGPETSLEGRLIVELPSPSLPAAEIDYLYRVTNREGRSFSFRLGLKAGNNDRVFSFPAPARGEYSGRPGYLLIRDFFGFTRREIPLPGEERLLIRPKPAETGIEAGKIEGGDRVRETPEKRKTDEFLEVRDYVAGDDQRRIDWKLYAHAGRLLVRIGEDAPPPSSFVAVVTDTTIEPSLLYAEAAADAVDRMASLAARIAGDLANRGRTVLLASTDRKETASAGPGRMEEALDFLAGIASRKSPGASLPPRLEEAEGAGLILLAFPGSPALPGLLAGLSGKRGGIELLLVDPAPGPLPEERSTAFTAFFLQSESGAKENRRRRAFRTALDRRLQEDCDRYRGAAGRNGNVRIV